MVLHPCEQPHRDCGRRSSSEPVIPEMVCSWAGDDPKDLNHTQLRTTNNAYFVNDQCDQKLSINDLSDVNGDGVAGLAGYSAINGLALAIPAFIDAANGFPWLKECINSKHWIKLEEPQNYDSQFLLWTLKITQRDSR